MPTYNPKDMAYVLQMSKTGSAYTPAELALMQDINKSVAGGAMTGMPTGAAMTPAEAQRMAASQQAMRQQAGAAVTPQEMQMMQAQPTNRLAQLQAAANAQLASQGQAPNPNMANIAKYFQGQQ